MRRVPLINRVAFKNDTVKTVQKICFFPIGLLFFFTSCKTFFHPAKAMYAGYQIAAQQPKDTGLVL